MKSTVIGSPLWPATVGVFFGCAPIGASPRPFIAA